MSPLGTNPPEQKDLLELEGVIECVIYSNEENGYTVCELSLSDEEYITAVGTMPYAVVGESVKALGQWTVHRHSDGSSRSNILKSSCRQPRPRFSNTSPPKRSRVSVRKRQS